MLPKDINLKTYPIEIKYIIQTLKQKFETQALYSLG